MVFDSGPAHGARDLFDVGLDTEIYQSNPDRFLKNEIFLHLDKNGGGDDDDDDDG